MPDLILDNEAVQALADPRHRKHRRVLAMVDVLATRGRRGVPHSALIVPAAVQVEAGWDRGAARSGPLNRLRAQRPGLDGPGADRAAAIVAALGVSVADAHVGQVLADIGGAPAVFTSDPHDMGRIAAELGVEARIITI